MNLRQLDLIDWMTLTVYKHQILILIVKAILLFENFYCCLSESYSKNWSKI